MRGAGAQQSRSTRPAARIWAGLLGLIVWAALSSAAQAQCGTPSCTGSSCTVTCSPSAAAHYFIDYDGSAGAIDFNNTSAGLTTATRYIGRNGNKSTDSLGENSLYRTVLEFDPESISDPGGITVSSATVTLDVTAYPNYLGLASGSCTLPPCTVAAATNMEMHLLNSSWSPDSLNPVGRLGADCSDGPTYFNASCSSGGWSVGSQVDSISAPAALGTLTFTDVAAEVLSWVNTPASNHGVRLRSSSGDVGTLRAFGNIQLNISYTCNTGSGYALNGSSVCVDVDECASDACGSGTGISCANTDGSYVCTCSAGNGWELTGDSGGFGGTCSDRNDCVGNTCNAMGGADACLDTAAPGTGYTCDCSTGYDDADTDLICENIDGCIGNTCNASGGATGCTDDPPPAGVGVHTCDCDTGYTESAGVCEDDDECAAGNPCGANGEATAGTDANGCTNTSGAYTCNCQTGYSFNGSSCVDDDECSAGNPCGVGGLATGGTDTNGCTNVGGGYTCNCDTPAYFFDGSTCSDYDACAAGNPCGANGEATGGTDVNGCTDAVAPAEGNSCNCAQGFISDFATDATCVNDDECTRLGNPCDDGDDGSATCTDYADGSGYFCTCSDPVAFTVTGDSFSEVCVNANECTDGTANCDSRTDGVGAVAARSSCTDTPTSFTCACNAGFTDGAAEPGTVCDDIDECFDGGANRGTCDDGPDAAATCTNLIGTYSCTCSPGYELDATGTVCVDIDECDDGGAGRGPCDDEDDVGSTCTNTDGGYTCTCTSPGWAANGDATECNNLDECAGEGTGNSCDPDANGRNTCIDNNGSYTCDCDDPWYVGDGTTACADVDECTLGTDNCSATAVCMNAPGAFTCACWAGFTGDGVTCTPVDECADDTLNNCDDRDLGVRATCTDLTPTFNGEAGFSCACNTGWSDDDTTGTMPGLSCSNIDECTDGTDTCDDNATCTDNDGSYDCECFAGYRDTDNGEVGECVEIDECTEGTDTCDANATCSNTPLGSYSCQCLPGFTDLGNAEIGECQDQNECNGEGTGNDCDVNAVCLNSSGAFSCQCLPGFEDTGTARTGECRDYDECAGENGGANCDANASCENLPVGSFTCSCDPGYVGSGTLGDCVNADECAGEGSGNLCDPNATCADTIGSYTCTCNSGFTDTGTGFDGECVDDDECAGEGIGNNCSPNATCTNNPGSFSCACNSGYQGSGVTCLDINECAVGTDTCRDDQVRVNAQGSFACECPAGESEPDPDDGSGCQTLCGDNVLAGSEECDYDASVGELEGCVPAGDPQLTPCTVAPGYRCVRVSGRSVCVRSCGDGVLDVDEECDLGAAVNGTGNPVECRADCSQPRCGDGILDTDRGETCDDANADLGDGCEDCAVVDGFMCNQVDGVSQCSALCGDGVVDPGEQCDDGADNSDTEPDACRTNCGAPACGDGVVDTGEDCDDADANSDSVAGACRTSCQAASCGDGVLDPGEDCDDGTANAAEGPCDVDCTLVEDEPVEADGGTLDGSVDLDAGDRLPNPDGKSLFGCQAGSRGQGAAAFWLMLAGALLWRTRRRTR